MTDLDQMARDFWVKFIGIHPAQINQGDEREVAKLTALLRAVREADAKVVEGWEYNDAEDVDGLAAAIRNQEVTK